MRRWELWFWPLMLLAMAILTATADFLRDQSSGRDISFWQPYIREIVSGSLVLALLPFIYTFHRKLHWRRTGLATYVLLYLLLSIIFGFIHILGTVLITQAPYVLDG
ncbi:MAG: hypothetical protein V3R73_06895, partial [Sphingomonadales bacterium]